MSEHEDRENFIPFQKKEIIEMCCEDGRLPENQRQGFRDFCKILESYYHFEYFALAEKLKETYYPFNPDKDTKTKRKFPEAELKRLEKEFLASLTEVLQGANYENVSQEDLEKAMHEQSLFTINLDVDFADFAQFLVFKRGENRKTESIKKLMGLKTVSLEMDVYERVVLYIQFKDAGYFKSKKKKDIQFEPGSTILKLFKSIPKADIEMLFPNAKPQMSRLQKIIMGGAGIGAGVPLFLAKVLPAIPAIIGVVFAFLGIESAKDGDLLKAAIQGLVGIAALGGFLFKQWSGYKTKKLQFAKILSDNLYFRNLDNNVGVFHHLIDAAEEEECKEAILAYYFLCTTQRPLTEEDLDNEIEQWFDRKHGVKIDFEVDDAVGKLQRLEIGQLDQNKIWSVLNLEQAKARIDHIWDNLFSYNES
jgi:hypothetical protein